MLTLPPRVLVALQRFNAAHPWDHNAHYHAWILRQLPRHFGRALDVGCGTGDLANLLALRGDTVHGIDSDPKIIELARELTPSMAPVVFTTADALTEIPDGDYDVITCVAVIHHLPFTEALTVLRQRIAPGGTLVVVGLSRPTTAGDQFLQFAAVPLNAATGWLKSRGRTVPAPASMAALTRPASMSFPEIVQEARAVLPGARLRRRLFWRYSLVWHHG